jgi:hypothetical protein
MVRTSALAGLSLSEIKRELARRERTVRTLERRRAALLKKVAALDAMIAASGGTAKGERNGAAGGGRIRPKNEMQLLDALKATLKGKTMGVAEVSAAVQKAGYKTTSSNFKTIVNGALLKKKYFRRVERGQYTAG